MRRQVLSACLVLSLVLLYACASMAPISSEDVGGAPTVYAKVINPPNPKLLGHYRRSNPDGLRNPWAFNYWMVKRGDKYAVYYYYDSHRKNAYKGWADFTIDGNTITSNVDGVTFFIDGDKIRMGFPGRTETYHMMPVD